MLYTLLQVGIGGALGACARFLITSGVYRWLGPGFPWGTLAVNVLGSFAMGLFTGWLVEQGAGRFAPFLLTGLLGGFTTFSAFSLDAVALYERGAGGVALAYVTASVLCAIAALVAGLFFARGIVA